MPTRTPVALTPSARTAAARPVPGRRDVPRAEYHLRIARPRPRGSVDIGHELIRAATSTAAVAQAAAVMDRAARSGWSGVAMLTDGQGCLIWSQRRTGGTVPPDGPPANDSGPTSGLKPGSWPGPTAG